jgi:outer membrane cobalamin receptor
MHDDGIIFALKGGKNMRKTALKLAMLFLAAGVLSVAGVLAAGSDEKVNPPKPTETTAVKPKPVMMTGSLIPAKVDTSKRVSDGPLNVRIISRAEIEQSGAASVAQVLAREPGIVLRRY